MKIFAAVAALAALVLLAACAPTANPLVNESHYAGFWAGLWHGIIAPLTLLISLFTDSVQMYEVSHAGWRYDLGFAIGAGILFGCWRTKH
jgi:hypothetical protein